MHAWVTKIIRRKPGMELLGSAFFERKKHQFMLTLIDKSREIYNDAKRIGRYCDARSGGLIEGVRNFASKVVL